MSLQLVICDLEPFVSEVTPQPGSLEEASTAGELFQTQIEDYLVRMLQAMCDDLTEVSNECCVGYQPPIRVRSTVLDIPSIGANGSFTTDIAVVDTPLGTHILSWAPLTDATSIDDLMIQFVVVADDVLRITIDNPSAGATDPDEITFQFITATAEDTP